MDVKQSMSRREAIAAGAAAVASAALAAAAATATSAAARSVGVFAYETYSLPLPFHGLPPNKTIYGPVYTVVLPRCMTPEETQAELRRLVAARF